MGWIWFKSRPYNYTDFTSLYKTSITQLQYDVISFIPLSISLPSSLFSDTLISFSSLPSHAYTTCSSLSLNHLSSYVGVHVGGCVSVCMYYNVCVRVFYQYIFMTLFKLLNVVTVTLTRKPCKVVRSVSVQQPRLCNSAYCLTYGMILFHIFLYKGCSPIQPALLQTELSIKFTTTKENFTHIDFWIIN